MSENVKDNSDKQIVITEKNLEILITKFIPTSQYFERSFQALQIQIDGLHEGQKDLKREIDRRAESLEKGQQAVKEALELQIKSVRNSQEELKVDMDRRFEQVDRRFEQVDKRFEQIDVKLDKILERVDTKIDAGLRENRAMTIRLFTFAMVFAAISMAGLLAKMTGLF